jgi:cyclophilin family peptidyl-prolyl cis-trans isomerase
MSATMNACSSRRVGAAVPTVHWARLWRLRVAALCSALLVAACGGGGGANSSGGGGSSGTPSVSSMQASTVAYGRTMSVTVTGQSLDQGIEMETDSVCSNIAKLAGGNESSQIFTCRVGTIGEYNMTIRSSSGRFLASLKLNVPLPQVTLSTARGNIVVELDLLKAPVSVDNFLRYVNDNPSFYRNTLFHRVEKGNVIQAGGYTTGLVPKASVHAPIALESQNGLKNVRGSIGMAREASVAASATAQFFFNLKDNPEFDYQAADKPGFAVFGKVISGLDVVDSIGDVPVRFDLTQNLANVPVSEVVITAASQTK